jgi:hypothetical protein
MHPQRMAYPCGMAARDDYPTLSRMLCVGALGEDEYAELGLALDEIDELRAQAEYDDLSRLAEASFQDYLNAE